MAPAVHAAGEWPAVAPTTTAAESTAAPTTQAPAESAPTTTTAPGEEKAPDSTQGSGESQQQAPGGTEAQVDIKSKSVILMEQSTGQVLYSFNPDEQYPPASITKIMTLLLVMEAVDSGKISIDDMATCSQHAADMGGSQIWLEPNEQMSVNDLLKATAVSSANDAAVCLAEHVAGSEEAFVAMMNERAQQLGMKNTTFINANGLDAQGHLSTARDIAIMSMELLKHPKILEYSTIWMDSLRGGQTQLVNTNKMIRFYDGATGLKTGTTNGAGSCLSASATRGGMTLIAVTLGSATSDERFYTARKLLDFGFANYEVANIEPLCADAPVKVTGGVEKEVACKAEQPGSLVLQKGRAKELTQELELLPEVTAPVEQGQTVGRVVVKLDGEEILSYNMVASQSVEKMTFGKAFGILFRTMVG
ncbi:D-alanyl-D-alanine carboxypeptidase [Oscillospiraceae bacterium NSJ-54]|uniref:serine-type D-Ala-D-Ala carboxypeptidase n=2 Tax=Zongyangia hominis TaxID=2763677 RepID=A0A926IC83_9FIRM|nr:D-alanyl-D-alanine carboxypeptidase [Zongyangia hominis]